MPQPSVKMTNFIKFGNRLKLVNYKLLLSLGVKLAIFQGKNTKIDDRRCTDH